MMTQPASPANLYSPLPKRSTFLTILCILTFLSCAFGILNAVVSYSSAGTVADVGQDALETMRPQLESEFAGRLLDGLSEWLVAEKFRQQALTNFIYNVLTLAGAFLMWKRNKIGFYVYVVGVGVVLIAPFFIFGGFLGGLISASTSFMSLVFIVLYALNLKDMRWSNWF